MRVLRFVRAGGRLVRSKEMLGLKIIKCFYNIFFN
jgi:hypothetical protein